MIVRVLLAAALLAPVPALAQEAIATARAVPPPAAEAPPPPRPAVREDPNSPEAIGRWARGVIAGAPAERDEMAEAPGGCIPPTDGKPHGEVWAGIGTHGYRQVGGAVTVPVGKCGYATIAVDNTDFDRRKRRR